MRCDTYDDLVVEPQYHPTLQMTGFRLSLDLQTRRCGFSENRRRGCERVNTIQREQYGVTIHLFIGTGRSPSKSTFMSSMFTHDRNTSYK
jgi:hypothetical protein